MERSSEKGSRHVRSEAAGDRILTMESEADRKILMKVKSEEGKILKLKKEYETAVEGGLLPSMDPKVKAAQQPAGKKVKKKLVKKLMMMTKAQIDLFKAMAAHPGPIGNLTEDQLNMIEPKSYQYTCRQIINIRTKRLAYIGALVGQQQEFGFAVDESEVEVTDHEGDSMVN